MVRKIRFPRLFIGWWVVATGIFLNFWGAGYFTFGLSAMFKSISSELNLIRAATSVVASIGRFGSGLGAPVSGRLTDRIGPKRVIYFGISIFGLGLILMYFVNSLWGFYLAWGILISLGHTTASAVAMNAAIINWFVKKRGLALSIRFMVSGALALPVITWIIVHYGWRVSCLVGGVVMIVVGFILTKFFVKDHRPEYYGLLPDGAPVGADLKEDSGQMIDRGVEYAAEVEEIEFTFRQAVRTPTYWLLILSQIGPSITMRALMIHIVPLLTDRGMSLAQAAASVTIAAFANPVTRLTSGLLVDRLKKQHLRIVMGTAFLLLAGGITLFISNQTGIMVYTFLILYFATTSLNLTVRPLIDGRYYGRKAIGSIRGSSMIVSMPVGILAPIYLGWVYDTTGSYEVALYVTAALLLSSALFMFLASPPKLPAGEINIPTIG
ncbi:MFS transporter [Chloroflexota bacterium]